MIFLVEFLVVPASNDPYMSHRLKWSFRYIKYKNVSIISEFINRKICHTTFAV